MLLTNYQTDSFYDEMFSEEGAIRQSYHILKSRIEGMDDKELLKRKASAEKALLSLGITFNVYGDEEEEERIMPFDIIPRIVTSFEWKKMEEGLKQRIRALNLFIQDVYGDEKIIKDGVIPAEIVYSSSGYLKECIGIKPPKGIWIHITGTDLVRDGDGQMLVLEDNLRCPSGVSYVLENREVMKKTFPELFASLSVRPIYDYPIRLRGMLEHLSDKPNPNIGVLTPGIYNSAYYEHSFLASRMGVPLVEGTDLTVRDDKLYMRTTKGLKQVDVLYRRIDDTFMDPKAFRKDSLLGVPGIFEVFKKGNVALANAPGTGVADDKVIYSYVPDFIKYYLGEEPIIPNVPTYLCSREKDLKYVCENIGNLVVKAANGAGGYGMIIGPVASEKEKEEFVAKVKADPRNYIAQPVLSLSRIPTLIEDKLEGRHVDLRPFILYGEEIYVMPGGLTRVALRRGSLVVNSSQGGGSKDTWVMG
ncbi:circularly permuted type 2 ATP-grasp protein [Leptospira licerasiae]|uniref:Circularly permuted ATPgrasp domain protein n=1 Tax=Leptospira licerasiae str. MMD4847 TaxID=1049971 RepID=A0ABN0HAI0_9LEPT|nr:circularly permuted type 2 ATP-grasp protein [Leptospira licerasiae]EIE00606.1 PF04169 domain / circularly permuted ATPgrasp domain multi-domain protein [Leptospira licerasiae serovar Varillal str. VAR 010]EJZ42591.1 circularly permuted ATPgrasp domain protein [Leptospira licerasiae str. MMD4847]TGM86925.1 circularly permuted type 2 ATP-grasp protein [Leptospira licerasiae]